MTLLNLFYQIETQTSGTSGTGVLVAAPFVDGTDRHVAKDRDGRPVLLICVRRQAGEPLPVSYVLENLRVAHDRKCRIVTSSGAKREDYFTVVECLSDDKALQELFLRSMEALLSAIPSTASLSDVADVIDKLIFLFQAIRRPQSRPTMGLWSELLLITSADEPHAALLAWHDGPMETVDFSAGDQRLEVKCSGDRTRRHHFSLEQAYAPEGVTLVIASMFVEPISSGTSLGELWDRARELAGSDAHLLLKIDRVCIDSLGSAWEEARHKCFDRQRALQSLQFFDSSTIPRIPIPVPPAVSEVHFRADLSVCESVPTDDLTRAGGLFQHILQGQ